MQATADGNYITVSIPLPKVKQPNLNRVDDIIINCPVPFQSDEFTCKVCKDFQTVFRRFKLESMLYSATLKDKLSDINLFVYEGHDEHSLDSRSKRAIILPLIGLISAGLSVGNTILQYKRDKAIQSSLKTLNDNQFNLNFFILSAKVLQIEYCFKDHFEIENDNVNTYLASAVASWARVKIFDVINKLTEVSPYTVLYVDTEGVYVRLNRSQNINFGDEQNMMITSQSLRNVEGFTPPIAEEWALVCGSYLGYLKSDLKSWIKKWVSSGAKSYSYQTEKNAVCSKLKGFTLNYQASQIISFDTMWEIVSQSLLCNEACSSSVIETQNEQLGISVTQQYQIVRKPQNLDITTITHVKPRKPVRPNIPEPVLTPAALRHATLKAKISV